MRRALGPVLVLGLLLVLELGLGRALAAREPLQALLTGKLWVGALALGVLCLRLFLLLVAPGWLAARWVEGWLGSRAARRSPPSARQS